MEINWLKDFLTIAEERSFSRAAERRAITQSAFSRRIRALEEWVGVPLLDRSTHKVQLTPSGERFRPAVVEALQQLSTGREDALGAANGALRSLHFAATHALAMTFFPTWLRGMEALAPLGATIQLTADNMVACERLMIERRVHFLICHCHPAVSWKLGPGGFHSVRLGEDVMLPVAAPQIAAGGPCARKDVLAYSQESGMGRILASVRVTEGEASCKPVFSSHLASALVTMARDGRGVAWVPRSLVVTDLAGGRLVLAGAPEDTVEIEIRLFRPRARLPAAAESFWERIKGQMSSDGQH